MNICHKIFIFCALALLLSSCGDDYCPDECTLDRIIFYNLSPDELNNLKIIGYKKDSEFKIIEDSSLYITDWIEYDTPQWQFEGILNKDLNTDLDYLFDSPAYRKECRITNIKVEIRQCSFGLLEMSQSKAFDGYYVNGDLFACQIIKVIPIEY